MIKILALAPYAFPERIASSHLDNNLDEAYDKEGFIRIVYTPFPCRGISDSEMRMHRQRREVLHNGLVIINRFWLFKEGKSTVQRALRYILCALIHFFMGCFAKEARTCNLIVVGSTPPIQGAMAALVKSFRHIPLIYILQDIFPDSLVGAGLINKNGFVWKIGRAIENYTYRKADKIIVISNDFKKNIISKGVPEEKIEVIYNWVDEEKVISVSRNDNLLFDRYNLNKDYFYISYSGNIGLTQNMDMLLSVMEELKTEEPNIQLIIIGEGAYRKKVESIIRTRNLGNVTLLPFQPYEDISHVFSIGDAGLVISKPGVGSNSVPSKTWSIMSASRPVLANFDENELKDIITRHNCGLFTKAGDKIAFKESILKLYRDPRLCKELGDNGRQFILSNLTKEVGTKKYVNVIRSFL